MSLKHLITGILYTKPRSRWEIKKELHKDLGFKQLRELMVKLSKGSKYYRAKKIDVKDYKRADKGLGYSLERIYGFNSSESKEPPIEYCTEDYSNESCWYSCLIFSIR